MDRLRSLLLIAGIIIGVSVLHYTTSAQNTQLHEFYRRLYYIPIIISSFRFGLRGGLLTGLISGLLYAPHLLMYVGRINVGMVNQISEIFLFIIVGGITGSLYENEQKQKRELERQYHHIKMIESYTDNILQSIVCGLMAIDQLGNITRINKAGLDILGLPENERILLSEIGKNKNIQELVNLAGQNQTEHKTKNIRIRLTNGEDKVLGVTCSPMYKMQQQLSGTVIVFEDLTDVHELEERVKRSERLASVGKLAAFVAHEIRNPLAIIKTITQTLQRSNNQTEVMAALDVVEEETNRANLVVQGLLDLARVKPLNSEFFKLKNLLDNVNASIKRYAAENGVTVRCESGEDFSIKGDFEQLRQVFINLGINAIQAMPNGGELAIVAEKSADYTARISFCDQGAGINDEQLKQVFEPFFTTKVKGTGLGLSISLRIVEAHGGNMSIDSHAGQGTVVHVMLPLGGAGIG